MNKILATVTILAVLFTVVYYVTTPRFVESTLITLESTPTNPLTLINSGLNDASGVQVQYSCSNNDATIHFITEYKILRNNSHYIVSERTAPNGYMVDLHANDVPITCSGWSNS